MCSKDIYRHSNVVILCKILIKIPRRLENVRLTLKHIKNLCTCVTNIIYRKTFYIVKLIESGYFRCAGNEMVIDLVESSWE